jgi:hypothetical protein
MPYEIDNTLLHRALGSVGPLVDRAPGGAWSTEVQFAPAQPMDVPLPELVNPIQPYPQTDMHYDPRATAVLDIQGARAIPTLTVAAPVQTPEVTVTDTAEAAVEHMEALDRAKWVTWALWALGVGVVLYLLTQSGAPPTRNPRRRSKLYNIYDQANGVDLGTYEGASKQDALDSLVDIYETTPEDVSYTMGGGRSRSWYKPHFIVTEIDA